MNTPIIFCHYSNSEYLPYVFELVRITNSDKDIILLGDKSNQRIAKEKKIKHFFFNDFNNGLEIETFDHVYKLVKGAKHRNVKGVIEWVNFVFRRWFYIYNFLTAHDINNFWHFDSDTMITDSLSIHEKSFLPYDCTEQCNGSCMNGFISGPNIVLKYLNKINELFQDEKYIQEQQKEFDEKNVGFAFTEMRAYEKFKEDGLNSARLNSIIDGSTFDDCICQEHEMEMEMFMKAIETLCEEAFTKEYKRLKECHPDIVRRILRNGEARSDLVLLRRKLEMNESAY